MTGVLFLLYQAYRDTLQTQWSWLLQITKCIDIHLKENAAYNQVTGNLPHGVNVKSINQYHGWFE